MKGSGPGPCGTSPQREVEVSSDKAAVRQSSRTKQLHSQESLPSSVKVPVTSRRSTPIRRQKLMVAGQQTVSGRALQVCVAPRSCPVSRYRPGVATERRPGRHVTVSEIVLFPPRRVAPAGSPCAVTHRIDMHGGPPAAGPAHIRVLSRFGRQKDQKEPLSGGIRR